MEFAVYLNSVTPDGPLIQTELYLHYHPRTRLALKLFRREPAISKFVWNFTATHNSSPQFLTYVGSVLQYVLPHLQPGHG